MVSPRMKSYNSNELYSLLLAATTQNYDSKSKLAQHSEQKTQVSMFVVRLKFVWMKQQLSGSSAKATKAASVVTSPKQNLQGQTTRFGSKKDGNGGVNTLHGVYTTMRKKAT